MVERLALQRHAQVAHVREIRGRQPTRFMHLAEEHFLGRSQKGPPAPHLPLQRPQLSVGEPARVAALQLGEDSLGLQTRLRLQQPTDLRPDLGERIDARWPVMGPSHLAGQLLQPTKLACGLVIHVRPRCGRGQSLASRQQPPQLPHLFIADHRKPPCRKNLRIVYAFAAARNLFTVTGKINCRWREI
jgi:hypothetical protein